MPSETSRPQAETRTIIIDRQRLRIAIRPGNGTRTPLLLMNGIGVNFEVLQPFVDALDPAIEVIRFDVPGTGGSPAPRIPYRFSAHARLVTKMLDQLGYQQVDVLGVSWGGALVPLVNAKIMHRLIPHSQLYIFHDGHLGLGTSAQELAQVVDQLLTVPVSSSTG